jgi:hypothetical protein
VNLHRVAGVKLGVVVSELFLLDFLHQVHGNVLTVSR